MIDGDDGSIEAATPLPPVDDTVLPTSRRRVRHRLIALGTVLAAFAACGAATALTADADPTAAPVVTTQTSAPSTSTTVAPTTTSEAPPADPGVPQPDPAVAGAQQRLAELRYDPGPVDGLAGSATQSALYAFQKVQGIAVTGVLDPATQAALASPAQPGALVPNGEANRVEIDIPRQLLFVYQGGQLQLISHISTGSRQAFCENGTCGDAVTPVGSFRFSYRMPGWAKGPLGSLYNPVFFTNTGIAVHGSLSVPLYPASHGCVRIPMHIAEYFPSLVTRGQAVYVSDGSPLGPPPSSVAPTPPPDVEPSPAPVPDEPTTTVTEPTTTVTQPTTGPTTEPSAPTTTASA